MEINSAGKHALGARNVVQGRIFDDLLDGINFEAVKIIAKFVNQCQGLSLALLL